MDDDAVTVIVTFDNDIEMTFDLSVESWQELDNAFTGPRGGEVWRGITFADESIAIRLGRVLVVRTAP